MEKKDTPIKIITLFFIAKLVFGIVGVILFLLSVPWPSELMVLFGDLAIYRTSVFLVVILSLFYLLVFFGLSTRSPIARMGAIVLLIIDFFAFPFGTVVASVMIIYLLTPYASEYFERIVPKHLPFRVLGMVVLSVSLVAFLVTTGLLTGFGEAVGGYPTSGVMASAKIQDVDETGEVDVIVELTGSMVQAVSQQNMVIQKISTLGGEITDRAFRVVNAVRVTIDASQLQLLATDPNVKRIIPVEIYVMPVDWDRQVILPQLENSNTILDVDKLWDAGYTGDGIVVAVVDTGINEDIEWLQRDGRSVVIDSHELYGDWVHWHGTACFKYDTMVPAYMGLQDGYVTYEKIGEMVEKEFENGFHLVEPGVWEADTSSEIYVPSVNLNDMEVSQQKVTSFLKIDAPEHMYEIKTTDGRTTVCTPDQKYLVMTQDGPAWKEAQELNENDYIATSSYYDYSEKPQELIYDISGSKGGNPIVIPDVPTKEMYYIAGLIITDGDIVKISEKQINIRITNTERNLLEKASEYLQKDFGYTPSIRIKKTYSTNEINGREIHARKTCYILTITGKTAKIFNDHFELKSPKTEYQLTSRILNAPKEHICYLMRGMFDGDGSAGIKGLSFIQKNKETLNTVQHLLRTLGIESNIYSCRSKSSDNLNIIKRESIQKFSDFIGFNHNSRQEKLLSFLEKKSRYVRDGFYIPHIANLVKETRETMGNSFEKFYGKERSGTGWWTENEERKISRAFLSLIVDRNLDIANYEKGKQLISLAKGDINWIPVKEIISIDNTDKHIEYVYDFTVEQTHNFIAEGLIVHNCASCVASQHPEYLGMAPDADLLDVEVFQPSGGASNWDILNGWEWVANWKARTGRFVICTNSFGAPSRLTGCGGWRNPCIMCDAANNMVTVHNIPMIVAAGNHYPNEDPKVNCPGQARYVLTVGATDDDNVIASFSNVGPTSDGESKPDVVALE